MHNWIGRRQHPWATFCWKRKNLFFKGYHANKWMLDDWKGRFIPCDDIPNKSGLEWRRKQKNCTKRAFVHPISQFSFGRWTNVYFFFNKRMQKPVIIWKQLEASKRSFRIRAHRADKHGLLHAISMHMLSRNVGCNERP